MRNSLMKACLSGMVLVLILAVPAAAGSSTITSISPEVGYTGATTTVTITGTDFNTSSVDVRLMMEDKSNITATISSHTSCCQYRPCSCSIYQGCMADIVHTDKHVTY